MDYSFIICTKKMRLYRSVILSVVMKKDCSSYAIFFHYKRILHCNINKFAELKIEKDNTSE